MRWFTNSVCGSGTRPGRVSRSRAGRASRASRAGGTGLLLLVALLLLRSLLPAQASNAVPFSGGPILTAYGTPAANAPIRVCLVTATGTPCPTTGVLLYSDYNLTQPLSNPTTLNAQGIYNFFTTTAGTYQIQITPQPGTTYVYYVSATAGTSSGSVEPGGGYALPAYGSASAATVGPSNITTDSSGDNLNIPGAVTAQTVNAVEYAAQFAGADIGAKINAARLALPTIVSGGSTFYCGTIVLPETGSTAQTWSTNAIIGPCTNLQGNGITSSQFSCSVAGDCLTYDGSTGFTANFNLGYLRSKWKGFQIVGNGATGQNILHIKDANSLAVEDVWTDGASESGGACIWLDDAVAWTESNTFINVGNGYNCKKGWRLSSEQVTYNPASFGYNRFLDTHIQAGSGNIGLSLENNSALYNGTMRTTAYTVDATSTIFSLSSTSLWEQSELYVTGEGEGGTCPTRFSIPTAGAWVNQLYGLSQLGCATDSIAEGTHFDYKTDPAQSLAPLAFMNNTAGTAWVKLGTWSAINDGDNLHIEILGGTGYAQNSNTASNTTIDVKYGPGTAPAIAGAQAIINGNGADVIPISALEIVANGGSTSPTNQRWDIYVDLAEYTMLAYRVEMTEGNTWVDTSSAAASNPGGASSTVFVGSLWYSVLSNGVGIALGNDPVASSSYPIDIGLSGNGDFANMHSGSAYMGLDYTSPNFTIGVGGANLFIGTQDAHQIFLGANGVHYNITANTDGSTEFQGPIYVGGSVIVPSTATLPYVGAKAYSGSGTPTDTCSATVNLWAIEKNDTPVYYMCGYNVTAATYTWNLVSNGFANPMTTLGDLIYGGASGVATRLAGNTTTTAEVLTQTGTGSASAAPVWAAYEPAFPGTGTYTTGTSDTFTVTGATASSHCVFSPTNATAAAATVVGYVSAVTTNSVTITHVASSASGGTIDILCTPN